ncbi:rhomboid-like protein [Saccharothrix longispora]|uniref:rhomboid-like protein n=1 Tax=Saccharothrix longispora TaxID=33920 RepID=UPI0028FD5A83|nr:rhomboid-like protein [Saccharothrix longispora]MDU0290093.1 rhomboid-like protein [Saccharothrix longispora]
MRERFRRNPVTAGYLLAVTALALLTGFVFADGMSAQVRESLSTSAATLDHHPVSALLGSAFVLDPAHGVVLGGLALLAVAVFLGALEREVGPWRAAAVALAGHVGAALVTALVLSSGPYAQDFAHHADVGVDRVAFAAAGAVTPLAPGVLRVPWAALPLACAVLGARWTGPLPDPDAVGHVAAVLVGVCAGTLAVHRAYAAVGR